jgi:hypothetical protein
VRGKRCVRSLGNRQVKRQVVKRRQMDGVGIVGEQ